MKALDLAMDHFMSERDPYLVVQDIDPTTGELVCKVQVHSEPPLQWSILIGDALQNVRAALNYLACELTLLNLGPAADLSHCGYPIFTDPAGFEASLPRLIGGVSPAQRALLERSQPYTRRNPDQFDQLEVLQALANVDQHRALTLAWVSLRQLDYPRDLVELVGVANFGPLKDGAELARFRAVPRPGQTNMQMRINFAFGVTFADPGSGGSLSVRATLGAVHDRAADILAAFAPMFPAE